MNENEAYINELTNQWRPVVCTINFTAILFDIFDIFEILYLIYILDIFDIFSNIAKLFLDSNNDNIRVKLFDFAAGQLTRQITRKLFMNEKIATEPAELARQPLHLLKLPGDQSITNE